MFFVYALVSDKDGSLYIGHTSNPEHRLKAHNTGKTKSIKAKRPYRLAYTEPFQTREEAIQRERKLKNGFGRLYLKEQIKNKLHS